MNSLLDFILKVLLAAISFTFLLSWGYVKQQRKSEELVQNLCVKIEKKILSELEKKPDISVQEIEEIVKGTKASLFWSRNKVQINEPKKFIKTYMDHMVKKGVLKEVVVNNCKKYAKNDSED